ncbi:MAG: response regulator [Pseudodesulfovibrio sp.]|nr:response regulator [Pseudodesulfovibrio sp.]
MALKKFLIVDDDERFTELVAKKLEKFAQCVVSNSGDDALLQFEHHLREKAPFQAVFMDIEMPKMTGHEVVEKMRGIEKQNKIAPLSAFKLVMLTAHKDVKNVSKSFFKGGADAYIPKELIAGNFVQELEKANII